jgi:hypothetical protein
MTNAEARTLVDKLAPYVTILAAMGFAKAGVDPTIISLVAGGCLAVIDPRRNHPHTTHVESNGNSASVTTEPK